MKLFTSSAPHFMQKRFHKHKLLLDENMAARHTFPRLNALFDVKHIRDDLKSGGLSDPHVYLVAIKQRRLLVTYNVKDFKEMAAQSQESGVIGVSPHLSLQQIDTKLTALLLRSNEKALQGKFTPLTGET
jgi:predicted nuclease of predicted toxin-antitoxin system